MSSDISGQSQESAVYRTVGPSVSRRGFLRAGAATAGAGAVGVGGMRSDAVGTAQASFFEDATEWMIDNVATVGASYWLAGEIAGNFFDDEDLSGYVGSDNLWARIEEKAIELQITNEQVLSSIENMASFADRVALHEGMQAVIESFEADATQEEAQDAMEEAIDDDYYAPLQEDVLTAWSYSYQQVKNWYEQIEQHDAEDGDTDIQHEDVLAKSYEGGGDGYYSVWNIFDDGASELEEYPVDLVDGSVVDVWRAEGTDLGSDDRSWDFTPHENLNGATDHNAGIYILPNEYRDDEADASDDPENLEFVYSPDRFQTLWFEITESRDRVYAELSGFVSEVYNHYDDPSEIDTTDLLTPVDFYESASEEDDSAFVDAALRSLGLPRSNETVTVEFAETDVELDGALYLLDDDPATLQVGQQYDPDEEDETADSYISDSPVYFSYADFVEDDDTGELEEVAEVITVEEPFTVTEARDADGETIDSVDFDEGPTYDPSDIEGLIEQLEQQNQLLIEMQQEADSGGGGGWFGDGGGGGIVAVAIGALALIIAVFNSNN